MLQYIDYSLLCTKTEEACSEASEDFLNFLADCNYKVSREKAQLCQQSVKYLGLICWALKKMMFLNYGVGEDSLVSLGLQGEPTSQS